MARCLELNKAVPPGGNCMEGPPLSLSLCHVLMCHSLSNIGCLRNSSLSLVCLLPPCEGVKASCDQQAGICSPCMHAPAADGHGMLCLLDRAPETLLYRRRCQYQSQLADTMACLPSIIIRVRHACCGFCILLSLHDWCPQLQNVSMTDAYICLSQGSVLAPVS